ncbi:hypothetical protein C0Q70_20143 [Pomacea canaliculata]|uniref:Uncharacterized protein n=1 Tax=Pomacea canaliculata TaxID=400727 RepID=A0A2T7NEP7_POMCA|nr:hypothetical protein C0Q70_20143 [Pomacea canaliculata]
MSNNNAGRPDRQHDELNNSEDQRSLSFGDVNDNGEQSRRLRQEVNEIREDQTQMRGQLENRIAQLQEQVNNKNHELQDAQATVRSLEEEKVKWKKEKDEYGEAIKRADDAEGLLANEKRRLTESTDQLNLKLNEIMKEKNDLKDVIAQQEAKNSSTKEYIQWLEEECHQLQSRLEEERREKDTLTQELNSLRKGYRENEELSRRLQHQLYEVKTLNETDDRGSPSSGEHMQRERRWVSTSVFMAREERGQSLKKKLNEAKTQNDKLKQNITTLEQTCEEKQGEVSDLTDQKRILQQEKDQKTENCRILQEKLHEAMRQQARLTQTVNFLEQTCAEKQGIVSSLRQELEASNQDRTQLADNLLEVGQQNMTHQMQEVEARTELQHFRQQLNARILQTTELSERVMQLEREATSQVAEVDRHRSNAQRLEEQLRDARGLLQSRDKNIDSLREQVSQLETAVDGARGHHRDIQALLHTKNEELCQCQRDAEETTQRVLQLEREATSQLAEVDRHRSNVQRLEEQLRDARGLLQSRDENIAALREQVSQLETAVDGARLHHRDLEALLNTRNEELFQCRREAEETTHRMRQLEHELRNQSCNLSAETRAFPETTVTGLLVRFTLESFGRDAEIPEVSTALSEFFESLSILEDPMAPEVDIPLNAELPDNTIEPRDLPNHACTHGVQHANRKVTAADRRPEPVFYNRSKKSREDSGFRTIGRNEENPVDSLLDDNSETENFRLYRPSPRETKKNLSRENQKLKRERTWQREQRSLLQSQLNEQKTAFRKLEDDLKKALDEISSLEHQNTEKGAFITWIEEKLTTAEVQNLKWKEKESEMRESVTEQQNQRQMEREDTDAIITQLAQDLRKAEVTISTTKHEKSETLQWAEAKITALLDERSKWEEQKFQAREFKAKQEILLQQQEAKIRQLEHDLQEKQKSIEAFEGRSKYTKWMEDKLIRLEEDIMIRDDNRTKYKEEQNLMLQQREGKTLMKQAPGGLRETQGLEEQQSKFTEKNSKLRTQNEMAQNELNRLRREVAQLRELNDHQRERLEVLEAQRRSAKDQERAVGTQQTKCAVELARARTQIKQLQQQLGTKDTQIKNLLVPEIVFKLWNTQRQQSRVIKFVSANCSPGQVGEDHMTVSEDTTSISVKN